MKIRILLFSITTIALGATAWFGFKGCCDQDKMGNAYIPRSEFQTAQGIKGAFEYYKSIKSNIYTGEIETEDFLNMKQAVRSIDKNQSLSKNADVSWLSMGPTNVGGRTRAILPFPNEVNTLIAGGVSGGLFKTTNAGQNWQRITTFDENLVVSSIAMLGNGAIYVSTGNSREGFSGTKSSGFMGGGLFVSSDAGATWSLVSDFAPDPFDPSSDWSFVNKIVSDGSNPDRLWIGADFGLYPYIHGSNELGDLPNGLTPQSVKDLAISTDGDHIIVSAGPRVFVSTDAGANFEQVNGSDEPVLPSSGFGAIDLDVSPDDKNFMVACLPTGGGSLLGIFVTQNAGQTWNTIAPSSNGGTSPVFAPFSNSISTQGNYDNMVTIAPGTNASGSNEIIMGGIRLYKYTLPENTTPGIFLWEGINANFASAPGQAPSPLYVHSDIHTHAWDASGRLYIGCDGGIFRSDDRGLTWTSVNNNYTTTQYYAIAFSPLGQVLGGLQDNGSLWTSLAGSNPGQAVQFTGGDGFACEISQELPNFMFSTIYNGAVFRSATGGNNVTSVGNLDDVSSGGGSDFFTDIALHENINNQFSESFINYIPNLDDPYLQLIPDGGFELTANGDTIIGKVPAGTQIVIEGDDSEIEVSQVLTEDLNFYSYFVRSLDGEEFVYHNIGDTAKVKEVAQFMLAAALSNGVYVTREPLKVNGVPQWIRIATSDNSNPSSLEYSPDGDHLYVGFNSGKVVRYSGFNSAWESNQLQYNSTSFALTKTTIYNGSGVVTDIEVDYSQGRGTTGGDPASERVAISIGNYGGNGKVRISDNAASTTGASTFQNAWNVDNSITGMPCYSVVMDVNNPDILMVGTEFGVWYTGNSGDSWTSANNGDMNRVPVFDLRQQKLPNWKVNNSGVVYAGSHGRGIFRTDYLLDPATGLDGDIAELPALSKLKIYPNPVTANGTIQFDLGVNENVSLFIYSLDGRLVQSSSNQRIEQGLKKEIRFNSNDLAPGTYIIQVKAGNYVETGKFVKTR